MDYELISLHGKRINGCIGCMACADDNICTVKDDFAPLRDKIVEAEAVLVILSLCESERLNLISSDALLFEIGQIPEQERKDDALAILKIAKETIELTPEIESLAGRLGASGLKPLDALHLASASKVDYFCTCDDKFLKKTKGFEGLNIKVVSPTELVMEIDI